MATDGRERPVRVVVADDHPLYRDGLVRAIGACADLELAGEAGDGDEADSLIATVRPDVALLDVKMPGLGGIELCSRITAGAWPTRVVMISAYGDENLVARAAEAGAAAYLGKDCSREEICDALVRAGRGAATAQVP